MHHAPPLAALSAAALLLPLLAGAAGAQTGTYAPHGNPGACGAYEEAELTERSWFPGGEAGLLQLENPVQIRDMNAVLHDATISEEGFNEPAGRILFAAVRHEGQALLMVVYGDGEMRLYQRC